MNFLKGLGTFILGFLLFLSLTVFGVAFLAQSTILNADFVVEQVDRIDVSEIVHDLTEDMIIKDLPGEARFLQDAILDIIDEQEPWLKEQMHYVIYTTYDFLLSETDTLEIYINLESVKEGLRESIWEILNQQAANWLPDIIQHELSPYIEENFNEYVQLIPEEYVPPGITEMPEEQLLDFLDMYLQQIDQQMTQQGILPEVTGLLEVLLKPYYDDYFDEFLEIVPSEIVWDEEAIPSDVMDQLEMAREYISYFQAGFYWLIVLMVLLAAGIFLVNWNVRVAARALGIDLIVFGVLDLVGVIMARLYNPIEYIPDFPSSLETMVTAIYNDILSIMMWFSIGVLIVGVISLVVSFFVKSKTADGLDD